MFVIAVEGELDMNTATDLERELEGPLAAAQSPLLIDLSRCEFIDSTGIALIVRSWQALDGDGSAVCALRNRAPGQAGARHHRPRGNDPDPPSREQALERLRS